MKPKLLVAVLLIVAWLTVLAMALTFGTEKVEEPIRMRTEVANTLTNATTTTTTTPQTTTTTVALSQQPSKGCPEFEPVLAAHGLEPVQIFSYIAWRESRCTIEAMNTTLNRDGSFDSGLLQINSTWKTVTRNICGGGLELLVGLDCNLRVAKYLLDNGGLGHWGMANKDLTSITVADKLGG